MSVALALLLQIGSAQLAAPLQMGYHFDRDTVTVGDHVTLILRVLAPRGAKVTFPEGPDTARTPGSYPIELVGKRATAMLGDTAEAAYRLSVWDIGTQLVNMPDIIVSYGGRAQRVSLAGVSVYVRTVLPTDTAQRKPKPARPLISLVAFDWRIWLLGLLALLLILLGLWLWWRYRHRAEAPVDPYLRAKAEFARVGTQFPPTSGPGQHFAGMVDVMRDYLAARLPGIRRSFTSREMLAAMRLETPAERELPPLLERADMIKFARQPASGAEASAAGAAAIAVVDQVEARIVAAEKAERDARASREKKLERAA